MSDAAVTLRRRKLDGEDSQAVKEVLTEVPPTRGLLFEAAVRGGHDPHIGVEVFGSPRPAEKPDPR